MALALWLRIAVSCGAVFHITGTFTRPCPDYIFYRCWNNLRLYSKLCSTGTRSRPQAPRAGGIAALCQPTVGRSLHNHRRQPAGSPHQALSCNYLYIHISLHGIFIYTRIRACVSSLYFYNNSFLPNIKYTFHIILLTCVRVIYCNSLEF